jgi:hypothetical protein
MGDRPGKTYMYNVLHLSGEDEPQVKVLQIAVTAYKAFVAAATPRGKETPVYDRDYWAISRSGKDQQSQTNFNKVKERDLEEDWEEILEYIDLDALPDIIEESKEDMFDEDIVQVTPRKALREIAKYMADDEEDEE